MTDQTAQLTTTEDNARTDPRKFASALFWIGPACFMAAVAIGTFASTQYNGTGLTVVAIALVPFGGLSMLLWLTVSALGRGK